MALITSAESFAGSQRTRRPAPGTPCQSTIASTTPNARFSLFESFLELLLGVASSALGESSTGKSADKLSALSCASTGGPASAAPTSPSAPTSARAPSSWALGGASVRGEVPCESETALASASLVTNIPGRRVGGRLVDSTAPALECFKLRLEGFGHSTACCETTPLHTSQPASDPASPSSQARGWLGWPKASFGLAAKSGMGAGMAGS
mmetsp:Transcript_11120/g.26104  ORF Transcript_11120/g.26104 Transcript_11120/m.26104 type:complete len:209 (+) Transcript_11120:1035-1661(+)